MGKTSLCILALTFALTPSFAQKVKRVEVCTGPYETFFLYANISFEDDKPTDTTFVVFGKNNRYQHITDLVTLKSGSFNEVWNFFTYCMEFLNKEDDGMTEMYEGNHLSVYKMMGMKGLMIYGQGDDSSGYTGFNLKYLDKLLSCMEDWENGER